jgi:hypothetical protein
VIRVSSIDARVTRAWSIPAANASPAPVVSTGTTVGDGTHNACSAP